MLTPSGAACTDRAHRLDEMVMCDTCLEAGRRTLSEMRQIVTPLRGGQHIFAKLDPSHKSICHCVRMTRYL